MSRNYIMSFVCCCWSVGSWKYSEIPSILRSIVEIFRRSLYTHTYTLAYIINVSLGKNKFRNVRSLTRECLHKFDITKLDLKNNKKRNVTPLAISQTKVILVGMAKVKASENCSPYRFLRGRNSSGSYRKYIWRRSMNVLFKRQI